MRRFLTVGVSGIALGAVPFAPAIATTVGGDVITDGDVDYDSNAAAGQLTIELSAIEDVDALGIYAPPATGTVTVGDIASGQVDINVAGAGDIALVVTNAADGIYSVLAEATTVATIDGAWNEFALEQRADSSGNGDATVDFTNAGGVSIAADAAYAGPGTVQAVVDDALLQSAYAAGEGNASVILGNTGTLAISSISTITGPGSSLSYAQLNDAIHQVVDADEGSATALLSNGAAGSTVDAEATINLTARASATGTSSAEVHAFLNNNEGSDLVGGIRQNVEASDPENEAKAEIANNGALNLLVDASATASAGPAIASADLGEGISQEADGFNGAAAVAKLNNTGSVTLGSTALADAKSVDTDYAVANATLDDGVFQDVSAFGGGDATASFSNGGSFKLLSSGTATAAGADTDAEASATLADGIEQEAFANEGNATAELANAATGVLTFEAFAKATGPVAAVDAYLTSAVYQDAAASDGGNVAKVVLTNDGVFSITGKVEAVGADARAEINSEDAMLFQHAQGNDGASADVLLDNNKDFTILASAVAGSAAAFLASAVVETEGIAQSGNATGGGDTLLTIDNSGVLSISAVASSQAVDAKGNANIEGTYQSAYADEGSGTVVFANAGKVSVLADTDVVGGNTAEAAAAVRGAQQYVDAADGAFLTFTNASGKTFDVSADAVATAKDANADADALGVRQSTYSTGAVFKVGNAGTLNVKAIADANGTVAGTAQANATGVIIEALDQANVLDIVNSGTLNVQASAQGLDGARAYATGLFIDATAEGFVDISGTISNTGTIKVLATGDATGAGTAQVGSAEAIGVLISADVNNLALTNSGVIQADAVTDAGGYQNAVGVLLDDGAGDDQFTLTNAAGSIIARQSTDLGATYVWGTAIDTDNASTPALINLMGDGSTYSGVYPNVALKDPQFGYVYGNIEIKDGDAIVVSKGETWFDGAINTVTNRGDNEEPLPGELEPAVIDLGTPDGSFTIKSDGLFFMLDDRYNFVTAKDYAGPSKVNVDSFTIEGKGVLALHLPGTSPAAVVLGDYPQVFANTVNLDPDGKGNEAILEVRQASANGLYSNAYHYEDVVVSLTGEEGLTGKFAQVRTQSVLLG
ncbi:beta strand repeat-containing protein, partial [Caenibius tardaugens]